MPKYAWSSIAQGAHNYGNLLIEWSLRQALDLPAPWIEFDSFRLMDDGLIERINRECEFLFSPGCTTLQHGQNAGYEAFGRVSVPKPCFGGCVWPAGGGGAVSMLASALGVGRRKRAEGPVDLTIARMMSSPVGSRDTFTHEALMAAGIESRYIGCPTLLASQPVERWRKIEGNRLAVSLSRASLPAQWRLIRRLQKRWAVSVMVHEPYERKLAKLMPGVRVVEFESSEQFMAEYAQADVVVTGRLHGALPAIRHGTRVLFYGDPSDTRFSLLTYLGIPIRPLSAALAEFAGSDEGLSEGVFERMYELRRAFVEYAKKYGIGVRLCV